MAPSPWSAATWYSHRSRVMSAQAASPTPSATGMAVAIQATVSISVTEPPVVVPVNSAPDAVDDGVLPTAVNTPLSITPASLLSNDTDPEGDTLSASAVFKARSMARWRWWRQCHVSTTRPGFRDQPASYTISDGRGGTDTATVSIQVGIVNGSPDAVDDGMLPVVADTPDHHRCITPG